MALLRRYLPGAVLLGVVGWAVFHILGHPSYIDSIRELSVGNLVLLLSLAVLKLGSMGVFTKIIVSSFNVDLALVEWFGLSAVSAMGNYLTPFRGGAALRAVYLKAKHDLPYPAFLSTLTALYLLTLFTSASLGLIGTAALYTCSGQLRGGLMSLFVLLVVSPLAALPLARFLRGPLLAWRKESDALERRQSRVAAVTTCAGRRLAILVERILNGWEIISSETGTLLRLAMASVANAGVTVLMIHYSFSAFGSALAPLESLVLSNVFMLSSMIPITPSGLGIAEVAIVTTSQGLMADKALSTLAAGLNRSVMIVTGVGLGIPFGWLLSRHPVPSNDAPPG